MFLEVGNIIRKYLITTLYISKEQIGIQISSTNFLTDDTQVLDRGHSQLR